MMPVSSPLTSSQLRTNPPTPSSPYSSLRYSGRQSSSPNSAIFLSSSSESSSSSPKSVSSPRTANAANNVQSVVNPNASLVCLLLDD